MGKPKSKYEEYKCKLCGKRASDKAGLAQHMLVHTSEKPFSCQHCKHTCKSKKYLNAHIKKVHNKATGNACKICGKKFHYKSLLEKHMYTHTNERPYKCEVCDKGFNSNYTLSTHRHIHSGEKPFKCQFCSYACRDSSTLRKHQERHMGITRLYQCTACDKSYKTKRVLKVHVGQAHMDQDMKTMPCPHCGKMFATSKNLSNHIRVFHERLYECKCDICGIKISNKYNMRAHLNKHMDFRPFKCTFEGCNKKFKDKTTLKKHEIIHYPDKHYVCRLCNRRFTRIQRFKAHQRQHQAKVKCVICDYCGKSFYNKNYVRAHIARAHVRPARYQCDECGLLTHNKPSIVMHLKYGHATDEDRQCKICKKTYKKHVYLKLHYWNTHCIKYKMNKRTLRRPKKRRDYMLEENEDLKEIQLLHEIKVEPVSDSEDVKDSGLQCEGPEITSGVSQGLAGKNFSDFFIEHVIMPSTSDRDSPVGDESVDVDIKTQKQAERFRREMLKQWKRKREMRALRVKRRYGDIERTDFRVKNEKTEISSTNTMEIEVPVKDKSQNNNSKINPLHNRDIHEKIANCSENDNTEKEKIRNNDYNETERINIVQKRLEVIESDLTIVDKEATADGDKNKILATNVDNLNDYMDNAAEPSNENITTVNNYISSIDSRDCEIGNKDDFDKNITKDYGSSIKRKYKRDFDNNHRLIIQDNNNIHNDKEKNSNEMNESNKESLIQDNILYNNKSALKQSDNITFIDNNRPKNLRRCVRNLKRKAYNESDSDDDGKNSEQDQMRRNRDKASDDQSDTRKQEKSSGEIIELLKPTKKRRRNATNKSRDRQSDDDDDDDKPDEGIDKHGETLGTLRVSNGQVQSSGEGMELLKATKRRRRNATNKTGEYKSDTDDDYNPDEDAETNKGKETDKDEEYIKNNNKRANVHKTKRRARNVRMNGRSDTDDDKCGDDRKDEPNTSNGFKINIHQCYVCFKLYETKEKLLDHCKQHFDVCNAKMLKKCPLCEYVTMLDLRRHIRVIHKINVNILYGTLKDRKNNNNKSRFYFNVDNNKINEIEVIPSIKNLNRQAFLAIDRKRRESNDKGLKKTKLIKKDGEWIVEKESINAKDYVLPETVDKELLDNDDDYAVKMQKLSRIAKKNGQKMLFPCDKCEKICQTLSALKLHMRRHDPNKKPFKKKIWKHKLSQEELEKLNETTTVASENRYAKPKPIIHKHKCDQKLKDFYENNIKGGDIEFWQFLKIFNKMTRENVNDFTDLEKRTEFGNHFYAIKNSEHILENDEVNPERSNANKIQNSKRYDCKVNRKRVVKKFSFKRTIMISRKEYIKRKAIKECMREKILNTNV